MQKVFVYEEVEPYQIKHFMEDLIKEDHKIIQYQVLVVPISYSTWHEELNYTLTLIVLTEWFDPAFSFERGMAFKEYAKLSNTYSGKDEY